MSLTDLQVEIKPRTTGQAVAIAARMLQERPAPLLAASLVCGAPIAGGGLLLLLGAKLSPWLVWAIVLLAAPLFSLPLTATVGLLVFSPTVRLGEALRLSLARTPVFAALFLFSRATALAGLAALAVPGLYLWRNSWFLGPIVLLERAPAGASLRRGRRFATGFHGHVLAHAANTAGVLLYATVAFATLLHFFCAEVLGRSIEAMGALTGHEHYTHLLGLVGFALAVPLATIIWFFVYLDVRIRKEGWDLEIAFRARAEQMERNRGAAI